MLKQFNILIRPFKEKVENLLKIGSYTNINGSDGKLQEIQLQTLRNIEDAMKVGNFGFNSKAPLGSRCIVAKIGNENIVIANEHIASIIDVAGGDSVLYNQTGTFIKLVGDEVFSNKKVNFADDIEVIGKIIGNTISMNNLDGVSGSFTTADAKTITVTNGIITNIV